MSVASRRSGSVAGCPAARLRASDRFNFLTPREAGFDPRRLDRATDPAIPRPATRRRSTTRASRRSRRRASRSSVARRTSGQACSSACPPPPSPPRPLPVFGPPAPAKPLAPRALTPDPHPALISFQAHRPERVSRQRRALVRQDRDGSPRARGARERAAEEAQLEALLRARKDRELKARVAAEEEAIVDALETKKRDTQRRAPRAPGDGIRPRASRAQGETPSGGGEFSSVDCNRRSRR